MSEIIINTLKNILDQTLETKYEAYLLGSQATGRSDFLSDWDFFIITDETFSRTLKKEIKLKIHRLFHTSLPTNPIDLIMVDRNTFESEKLIPNTISNEVFYEGIKI